MFAFKVIAGSYSLIRDVYFWLATKLEEQEADEPTPADLEMDMEMEERESWKPLSLTYVEYIEGDPVGYILAYSSLLPICLFVSLSTLIILRRDLHTIFFTTGILLNEVLNYCLKHIIQEERPMSRAVEHVKYGMPSSHAQYMAFFTTYMALFLYIRIHHNVDWRDNIWKHLSLLVSIFATILVCISRVYLKYHTISQVVCGAFIGFLFGIIWFILVNFVFTGFFQIIVSWPLSEYLMVRDLTPIPNVMWFEYCTQRNEGCSRHRKSKTNSNKKL